ncbi:MAG: beta strand repeat-containing protein [Fimbriiglobus sp.]
MRFVKWLLSLWLLILLGSGVTWGQTTRTWTGAAGPAWLTPGSWQGGAVAGSTANTNDDIALFNVATFSTVGISMIDVGSSYFLGGVESLSTITQTITNSSNSPGILTLNGVTFNNVSNSVIYNRNNSGQLWFSNGTNGASTLGLRLGSAFGPATPANVVVGSGSTVFIESVISETTPGTGLRLAATPGTLNVAGGGQLFLLGNNTFTGDVTVTGGRLTATNPGAIGVGPKNIIVENGATFQAGSGSLPSNVGIQLTGDGYMSGVSTVQGSLGVNGTIINGSVTMNSATTIAVGTTAGNSRINGALTGNFDLTLTDSGTLELRSVYNPNGNRKLTINGPTLILGGSNGAVQNTTSIDINMGTLTVGDAVSNNNRVQGQAFNLRGGRINFLGADNAATTQNAGALVIQPSNGIATISSAASFGLSMTANFASLTTTGGSVNFIVSPTSSEPGRVFFNTAPILASGNYIGAWATVGGNSFATYNQDGLGNANTNGIQAVAPGFYTLVSGTTILSNANNLAPGQNVLWNVPFNNTPLSTLTTISSLHAIINSNATLPIAMGSPANGLIIDSGNLLVTSTPLTSGITISVGDVPGQGTLSPGVSGTLNVNVTAAILKLNTQLTNTTQLIKTGPGSLVLAGGYPAGMFLGASGNVTIDTTSGSFSPTGQMSGPMSLTKAGTGTLTLTNAINNYTGNTTINGGVLSIPGIEPFGFNSVLGNPTFADSRSLTLNGGTLQLTSNSQNPTNNRGFRVGSSGGTIDTLGTATFQLSPGTFRQLDMTGTLTKTGPANIFLTGYAGSTATAATDFIVNSGALNFGTSYTGTAPFGPNALGIVVNSGGVLALQGNDVLGGNVGDTLTSWNQITINGGLLTTNASQFIPGGTVGGNGKLTLNGGTVEAISSGGYTAVNTGTTVITSLPSATSSVINAPMVFTAATGTGLTYDVRDGTAVNDLIVNGNIISSVVSSVVKTGAGTLQLAGTFNNHQGMFRIQEGAVSVAGDNQLGATPPVAGIQVTLGTATTSGRLIMTSTGTTSSSRYFDISAGGGTFEIPVDTTVTIAGQIQGTGTLSKLGAGTLRPYGSGNHSGPIRIEQGTLAIVNIANLGANPSSFTPGRLAIAGGAALQLNEVINFTGSNTGIRLGTALDGGLTNSIIRVQPFQFVTIPSVIDEISGSGARKLVKEGTGVLNLTAANTFTGGVLVSAGGLGANSSGATGSGPVVVNNTGTLFGSGTIAGPVTINTGGTIAPGNSVGTITINANVTIGGFYGFEIGNYGPSAPSGTGASSPSVLPNNTRHDMVVINGTANLAGLTVNPISLTGGFSDTTQYSWTILRATGGITGTPSAGIPSGSAFTSANGTFTLTVSGTDLVLNYTPIPEPMTIFGLGTVVFLGGYATRRRLLRGSAPTL